MKKDDILNLDEQIANMEQMADEDIDFSDIPEIKDFSGFVRRNTIVTEAEYDAWFRRMVEAGRRDVQEGRVLTHEEVTRMAEQRRARLLKGADAQRKVNSSE